MELTCHEKHEILLLGCFCLLLVIVLREEYKNQPQNNN